MSMQFFVPVSEGFRNSTKDFQSTREYKLYIDVDNDNNLQDLTSSLLNNNITGGGTLNQSSMWSAILRNNGGVYEEGDLANVKCRIDAKCGDNKFVTIFTGYTDPLGASRSLSGLVDDTISIKMYDQTKSKGTNRKTGFKSFINYTICDPSSTGTSIFHNLAFDMSLTQGQLDIYATLPYEKSYLPLTNKNTLYKELMSISNAYLAKLNFRYDGKLRFTSPFMDNWLTPGSEWTLNATNIHSIDGMGSPVLCNYVETEFDHYEILALRVIHKNVLDWDETNAYNNIAVSPGEYWPGGSVEGKTATLQFKDPQTNEAWTIATNIQTPTIGTYGSGSDIECADGLLTLHSFNGVAGTDYSLTEREPNGAQIILKNNTGSTVYIRKLTIQGQPVRILSKEYIRSIDNSVANDDIVKKSVNGQYMATDTQAFLTCQWWEEFGKVPRKNYRVMTNWLPQVQPGGVVSINLDASTYPPNGITGQYEITSYTHTNPNGPMGLVNTELSLLKFHPFNSSGSPTDTNNSFSGNAAPESIDTIAEDVLNSITYTEGQNGYNAGGGTTTPTQVTIGVCAAQGIRAILLIWDRQSNLTNFDHYEVQVSDDEATWYSLQFDGTDWKDALAEVTSVNDPFLIHTGIPHTGDADDPSGRLMYYRVRRVTKEPVNGTYSDTASATTNTVSPGDLAANTIYANNIIAAQLNTLLLRATSAIIIGYYGTGSNDSPDEGDRRVYIDNDEIGLEEYTGGEWTTVRGIKIGGAIAGLFLSMIGCTGIYHPAGPPIVTEYFPADNFKIFRWENNAEDHNGNDDWAIKSNLAYDTTYKKFGSYSLFATSGNIGSAYTESDFITIGEDQSAGTWFYHRLMGSEESKALLQIVYDGDNYIQIRLEYVEHVLYLMAEFRIGGGAVTYNYSTNTVITDAWNFAAFSYDVSTNKLYLVLNNIITEFTLSGSWSIGLTSFGVGTKNTTNMELYLDETIFAADTYIPAAVWAQHYNHNVPWDTTISWKDIQIIPYPGGRCVLDADTLMNGNQQVTGSTIKSGVKNVTASSNALDVKGVSTIVFNVTLGDIVIGGFANGVIDQEIKFYKYSAAGHTLTLEYNEASGTQKIVTPSNTDITWTNRGGGFLKFDGTFWHLMFYSNS
jgi:hypothetical protein